MKCLLSTPRRFRATGTAHSSRSVSVRAADDDVTQTLNEAVRAVSEASQSAATDAASKPADVVEALAAPIVPTPVLPSAPVAPVAAPQVAETASGPLSTVAGFANSALVSAENAVENLVDDTANAVLDAIEGAGKAVQENVRLPANLQAQVDAIGLEYADARAAFDEAPEVYLFLVSLLAGSVGYLYYLNEYGGYSGIYAPADLLLALNREDNIIVVDIRPEEEQEQYGVLDLRRQARYKVVSLPPVEVPEAVRQDVDNAKRLELQLRGALICSLANVNKFTKIVLLDTRGGSCKPLAREIQKQGYRGFVCKGGYALWQRAGLATKMGSYDISADSLGSAAGSVSASVSAAGENDAEKELASEVQDSQTQTETAKKTVSPDITIAWKAAAPEKQGGPTAQKNDKIKQETEKQDAKKKEKKVEVKADLAAAAAEAAAVVQEAVPKPVVDLIKEKKQDELSKNGKNTSETLKSKAWPGNSN